MGIVSGDWFPNYSPNGYVPVEADDPQLKGGVEDYHILAGIRVGTPGYDPSITGEKVVCSCDRCQHPVWLGPKQKQYKDKEGWPIMCHVCVSEMNPPDTALTDMGALPDLPNN